MEADVEQLLVHEEFPGTQIYFLESWGSLSHGMW